MDIENLYDLLEVSQYASSDDIKSAFRKLAKESHPDTGGSEADSVHFQKIRRAYEILIDPELRQNYNKSSREILAKKKKNAVREKLFTIETARKLEIILAWSTTRSTFRTGFVSSCLNRMAEGIELSAKQIESIDNILMSFDINIDQWQQDELRNSAIEEFMRRQEDVPHFSAFDSEDVWK